MSLLIRATSNKDTSTVLFDTGESATPISNNVEYLGINLNEVDSIVLSHGHDDHFGGLLSALSKIGKKGIPVYIHPNMLYQKGFRVKKDAGEEIRKARPFPPLEKIKALGGDIQPSAESFTITNGMFLRTGEIPRIIEQHKTKQLLLINGEWIEDPYIVEDVSLVAVVEGRGLVIIVGCSHAGILNIIQEAIQLTGESQVYAVIGGFHLAPYDDRHSQTVQSIHNMNPKLIVPCHCTGWRARHLMSSKIPDAYVEGSVGHKYLIEDVDTS